MYGVFMKPINNSNNDVLCSVIVFKCDINEKRISLRSQGSVDAILYDIGSDVDAGPSATTSEWSFYVSVAFQLRW